jgi:hypothetical protein
MRTIVEAARVPSRLLGEILVEQGLITSEELEAALSSQAESGRLLGEVLIERELISVLDLKAALLRQLGLDPDAQEGFGTGLWTAVRRRRENARADGVTAAHANYVRLEVVKEPSSQGPGDPEQLAGEPQHPGLPVETVVDPDGSLAEHSSDDARTEEIEREAVDHAEHQVNLAVVEGQLGNALDGTSEEEPWQAVEQTVAAERSESRTESDATSTHLDRAETQAVMVGPVDKAQPVPQLVAHVEYLVFAPRADGYKLSRRRGAPPEPGAITELEGVELWVVKVGCSPLPADKRPCVYLAA